MSRQGCGVEKTAVCFSCHHEWKTRANVVSRLKCPKCNGQKMIGVRCPGVTIMVCLKAEQLERAVYILKMWTGEGAES